VAPTSSEAEVSPKAYAPSGPFIRWYSYLGYRFRWPKCPEKATSSHCFTEQF